MIGNWEAIFREKIANEQRLMEALCRLVAEITVFKWRQSDNSDRLKESFAEAKTVGIARR